MMNNFIDGILKGAMLALAILLVAIFIDKIDDARNEYFEGTCLIENQDQGYDAIPCVELGGIAVIDNE